MSTDPSSRVDVWIFRIGQLAQIGLFAAAVIAFFYTVVPIYQKETLSEEIAKKQLDLKQLNAELASVTIDRDKVRTELADAKATLYETRRDDALSRFVFFAVPECTGLLVAEPPPFPKFGEKAKSGGDRDSAILAIDVPKCLRKAVSEVAAKKTLNATDMSVLRSAVERSIPRLMEDRNVLIAKYAVAKAHDDAAQLALRIKYDKERSQASTPAAALAATAQYVNESANIVLSSPTSNLIDKYENEIQEAIREAATAVRTRVTTPSTLTR